MAFLVFAIVMGIFITSHINKNVKPSLAAGFLLSAGKILSIFGSESKVDIGGISHLSSNFIHKPVIQVLHAMVNMLRKLCKKVVFQCIRVLVILLADYLIFSSHYQPV